MRFNIVEINYNGESRNIWTSKITFDSISSLIDVYHSSDSLKDIITEFIKIINELDNAGLFGFTQDEKYMLSVSESILKNGYFYTKVHDGTGRVNSKNIIIGREIVLIDVENKNIKDIPLFKPIVRENKLEILFNL